MTPEEARLRVRQEAQERKHGVDALYQCADCGRAWWRGLGGRQCSPSPWWRPWNSWQWVGATISTHPDPVRMYECECGGDTRVQRVPGPTRCRFRARQEREAANLLAVDRMWRT